MIRGKARPNDLDAYILVTPIGASIDGTNQIARGIGMNGHATIVGHNYAAHALYGLAVIDGHTGKVIAWQGKMGAPVEAYAAADETFWPADEDNVPPDQAKKLADAVKQAIAASVDSELQQAGLLPEQ
ncbi:MAG TPA: hypothetical protein VGM59_05780 [Dongiaceae bacterium]